MHFSVFSRHLSSHLSVNNLDVVGNIHLITQVPFLERDVVVIVPIWNLQLTDQTHSLHSWRYGDAVIEKESPFVIL